MNKIRRINIGILTVVLMLAMTVSAFGETLPTTGDAETSAGMGVAAEETSTAVQEDPTEPTEPTGPTEPTEPTDPVVQNITKSEALQIALKSARVKKSQIKWLEIEKEEGIFDIGFVKKSNKAEYDFEIAVQGGQILEKAVEYKYKKTTSRKKIGKKNARKKVAKASGKSYNVVAKGICKYKYKKKRGKYIIKFRSDNYRYEYELLAPNGKIIEWEYEYIGTR